MKKNNQQSIPAIQATQAIPAIQATQAIPAISATQAIPAMPAIPAVMPLYSLSLGALSCLLFSTSALLQALQYDRTAVIRGEAWRLVTGHFTHWNFEHLLWNVAVFCGLGILSELYDRKGYLICLGMSSLIIPLALWWLAPELAAYRGLSGVASGLFLFVALCILMDKIRYRQWLAAGAAVIYMTGFFAKILYETMSGATVFAAAGGVYEPVPLAHLIGGLAGVIAALMSKAGPRRLAERCACA